MWSADGLFAVAPLLVAAALGGLLVVCGGVLAAVGLVLLIGSGVGCLVFSGGLGPARCTCTACLRYLCHEPLLDADAALDALELIAERVGVMPRQDAGDGVRDRRRYLIVQRVGAPLHLWEATNWEHLLVRVVQRLSYRTVAVSEPVAALLRHVGDRSTPLHGNGGVVYDIVGPLAVDVAELAAVFAAEMPVGDAVTIAEATLA